MGRTIKKIRSDIKVAEARVKELWKEYWDFQKNCPHKKWKADPGLSSYFIEKCLRCEKTEMY